MCESNAFRKRGDDEELLLEEVTLVEPVAGGYRLRSLLGEEKFVAGRIERVDLLNHKIMFAD